MSQKFIEDSEEEELPDLFSLWTQEYYQKNPNKSFNCKDVNENLHKDSSSQPGPSGIDASCQSVDSSYVNRRVFSHNDSPASMATSQKGSNARGTVITFIDLVEDSNSAWHSSSHSSLKPKLSNADHNVNQVFGQGSILETNKSYHDSNGVPHSLAPNSAFDFTPEESHATREQGFVTNTDITQCVSNYRLGGELNHASSRKQDSYKEEEIEIGETFEWREQTPYWIPNEEHSAPPIDPVYQQPIEHSMYTSADIIQGYVKSRPSSDSRAVLSPQTCTSDSAYTVDQTRLNGFDTSHRVDSPVTENESILGESRDPTDEDCATCYVNKDDGCSTPCSASCSGYETNSDCEILDIITPVKPIKMSFKKINGVYKSYLLQDSRGGSSSHQRWNYCREDESCMESDGDTPNVETVCLQLRSKINNLKKEKQALIDFKLHVEEKHQRKVKKNEEKFIRNKTKLERNLCKVMESYNLKIQALTEDIDDKTKCMSEGQKLLQGVLQW
ncbi:uncharacterized protein LOC143021019 [Oratosquilla oratoria]|uniref:uncharacterized protein LOC143021019 n=1 Tax=Oratosquilla oratoria TaxID=337810 RepID=UPI003F760E83